MWDRVHHADMDLEEQDVDRSVVKTYVPEYQKDEWEDHAEELGMTQSEYVRVMVQAGRSGFLTDETGSTDSRDATPGGDVFEARILDVLRSEGPCSWDELLERVTDDVEDRMEETLQELQRENAVGYSGRDGGYTLLETDGGE